MPIVGVPCDDAVFDPGLDCFFMDSEASCGFSCSQHTAVMKSVVARAQRVLTDKVGNA
jgi:hypothetical protein